MCCLRRLTLKEGLIRAALDPWHPIPMKSVLVPVALFLTLTISHAGESQVPAKEKTFTNGIGMKMIWVPAGKFRMGDLTGAGDDSEQPVRTVELSGFYMGAMEVTQKQWEEVMSYNPSHFKGENLPVDRVNWYDAKSFCAQLSYLERRWGGLPDGYAYTLPTEAQWEYACRAGTEDDHAGDLDTMAWYGAAVFAV